MNETHDNPRDPKPRPSRRNFLAPLAAGAVAAAMATPDQLSAAVPIPSIRIPKEVTDTLSEQTRLGSFEGQGMTGAEVFARACKEENLAALFCCPGNYPIIQAISAAGIPAYGGRSEGSMASAADGFSRVTGEVTACSGTEGPGFTNMIMNIAVAHRARTPLLVLASNVTIASDDREYFIQTGYQQPTTEGLKKYGKRLIDPKRVHEYAAYAFRHLKTGVPGPVHLDFPGEIVRARFTDASQLTDYFGKEKYRAESRPHPAPKEMAKAIDMISKAERPVIVAGHGVFQRKAWEPLMIAAEKNEIAVVTSGPMRGHFPDEHRLSASLSPDAFMSADLVVFVGQYSMPGKNEYRFNPDVKAIRVHPTAEDLGRNWPLDLGIVGDEAAFLETLAQDLPRKKRDSWVAELAAARQKYEKRLLDEYEQGVKHSQATNTLHHAVLCKEVHDFLYKGDIDPKQTVTGWGGWTIGNCAARWLRAYRPGQEVNCPYQFSAVGPDLAMMIGAGAAVQLGVGPQAPYKGAPVVVLTSDAGIAYSMFELDTAAKYKIPVVCVVFNNNSWGMWPSAVGTPRSMHLYLFQENLRYDKMAEGLGARGEYVSAQKEFREALQRSYKAAAEERVSSLINVQSMKEFTSARNYPPGNIINPEPGVELLPTKVVQAVSPDDALKRVTRILEEYAARGVFRGFSPGPNQKGIATFHMLWHYDRRFELTVDARKSAVCFPSLLPAIPADSTMYRELKQFLASRHSQEQPPHRRIDRAKAHLRCGNRRATVSVSIVATDADIEYATRRLIHTVHEIFLVFLPDGPYYDYMVQHLGLEPDKY